MASPKSACALPRWLGTRCTHLPTLQLPVPDVDLDFHVATGEAMLRGQTIKYPLGGFVPLSMRSPIPLQPNVDELGALIQFWALDRNRPPETRQDRESNCFIDGVARDLKMACRRVLSDVVDAGQTDLLVKIQGINPHLLPAAA